MKNLKVVAAVLIIACILLAGMVFVRLQSRALPRPEAGFDGPSGMMGAPASPIVREEALNSIMGQLEAFRHNDFQKAMYYQSPMLRISAGDPDQFRQMMKTTYPTFLHFASVHFGQVQSMGNGEQVMVPVTVTGKDGASVTAAYMMERSSDGIYRVMGVSGGQR